MISQKINLSSGLYIHIPFCQVKCRYCAFTLFPGLRKETERYLTTLEKEMRLYQNRSIDTIYFGGGTPSILSSDQWKRTMVSVRSHFILESNMEMTVECNPENISSELIRSYRKEGVTRLSLGVQTTNDFLLKKIGRSHTWKDFLKAYRICRNEGIKNISIDLIFGLPCQRLKDWQETLTQVLDLHPEHLTVYPLDVEKKSAFYFDGIQVDQNLQADMYEWSLAPIAARGYEHYEVFSYSKPGYRCRHNMKYWKNSPCIGIGVSAAGYDGTTRSQNTCRFWDYIEIVESGRSPVIEIEELSSTDKLREEILLGLRLKEGISFTPEINSSFGSILERLAGGGYIQISQDGKRFSSTTKGWLLSNYIYRELLS